MSTFNRFAGVLLIDRVCVWMQRLKLKITDKNTKIVHELVLRHINAGIFEENCSCARPDFNPEIVHELVLRHISARILEEHLVHATRTPGRTHADLEDVQRSLRQTVDSPFSITRT